MALSVGNRAVCRLRCGRVLGYPVGAMMWGLIPDWLFAAIGAGVGGFIMHFVGRWSGKREGRSEANTQRAEGNAKSAQKAKDTRHEIETSDDQRLVDILSGKLHDRKR